MCEKSMSENNWQGSFPWSRVLLAVTGGIAAYKSIDVARELIKSGVQVQVIMTDSAREFVTALTFETLTGREVYHQMYARRGWEIEHIEYARWAQAMVIAPATANTLAKLAHGQADDALTTTALAFRGPILVAPAMNTAMWEHLQTQENMETLQNQGVNFVHPFSGQLACGEVGKGKLAPVESILEALAKMAAHGPLAGKRVLVTAGPTVEAIDPVRHLSNASSGRMGFALAQEAASLGARVTLVHGPVTLAIPAGVREAVSVRSACQMHEAVLERLADQDVCLFAAAVADYRPANPSQSKTSKQDAGDVRTLELKRNPDIAADCFAQGPEGQKRIGFAAQTENLEANALEKMKRKGFDLIVGNEISAVNPAFAAAENTVTLWSADGAKLPLVRAEKEILACEIWQFALENFGWSDQ